MKNIVSMLCERALPATKFAPNNWITLSLKISGYVISWCSILQRLRLKKSQPILIQRSRLEVPSVTALGILQGATSQTLHLLEIG